MEKEGFLTDEQLMERAANALKAGEPELVFKWTNIIKKRSLRLRNVDLMRGIAFLQMNRNYHGGEALKEELRYFPDNVEAQKWLSKIGLSENDAILIRDGASEFECFFKTVRPYTKLSNERLKSLYELTKRICEEDIPGDFIECGVAAGGSTMLIALVIRNHSKRPRKLHSFDTFEGMPEPGEEDSAKGVAADETMWGTGTCGAPEEYILRNCQNVGVGDIVVTHKGLFEETLPVFRKSISSIAFLHMDGDWYSSTKAILENLFDSLDKNALIQIDDYGAWDGCRKAIDEFQLKRDIVFQMEKIDDTGRWLRNPLCLRQSVRVEKKPHPFTNPPLDINNVDRYWVRSSILRAVKSYSSFLKGRLLDVGCGVMPYKQLIVDQCPMLENYIGMDIETDIYDANVDLRWDGKVIPLENCSVDCVMATEVLEHCPDPLTVLREINRVLKPGGFFFFTVPYLWPLYDAPWDFYRYTSFALERFLEMSKFVDSKITALGGWNASLAQMIGLWLKRSPVDVKSKEGVAKMLYPLYQQLVQQDVLPDPKSGDTMVTGWSGCSFKAKETEKEERGYSLSPLKDLNLCLVRSIKSAYSETFIDDHIKYISESCRVLYGFPYPHKSANGNSVFSNNVLSEIGRLKGGNQRKLYTDALALYFKREGIQVVLAENALMASAIYEACEKAQIPYVVHFHGADVFVRQMVKDNRRHFDRFFKTASGIIAVSSYMKNELIELGANDSRITVNACGVDVSCEKADPAQNPPNFVAIGRFVEKKAPHLTIKAFSEVLLDIPQARLYMAGDGPLLKRCQALVKKLGIEDSVTFCGVCSRRMVQELLLNARAFVQHSVTASNGDKEGLPVGIMEAGAVGLPVVSTFHSGIPDAIIDGENGFLVNEGDVDAMARSMLVLAQDEVLAGRMGSSNFDRISRNFSRKISIERLQSVLLNAIKEENSPILLRKDFSDREAFVEEADNLDLEFDQEDVHKREASLLEGIGLDRNNFNIYLDYAKSLYDQKRFTESVVCLKEASRISILPDVYKGLLEDLETSSDLDSSLLDVYREKVGEKPILNASKKLKILVVTNLLPPQEMGGFGRTVWEFCDLLIKRGHDLRVLCADMPHLAKEADADHLRMEKHTQRDLVLYGDWKGGRAIAESDSGKIRDICVRNHLRIREEVALFQPDVCMAGNLDFLGTLFLQELADKKIPVLHRLGNAYPGYPVEMTPRSDLYCLAGCSEWLNKSIQERGYPVERFSVVYPGSPIESYFKAFSPSFDKLRICFAGLLMPYKGSHILTQALGILKKIGVPFTCEFAGDTTSPEFVEALRNMAKSGGYADQIHFTGFLGKKELSALYARSNVMVFPSVFDEPFGKSQIEAMAAGLCVVSSGTGGSREIVRDGKNGLIFKNQDAEDLARQLYILHANKDLCSSLALQGQEDAFCFTTLNSVLRIEAEFQSMLNRI